jgi:hypothetical protein
LSHPIAVGVVTFTGSVSSTNGWVAIAIAVQYNSVPADINTPDNASLKIFQLR